MLQPIPLSEFALCMNSDVSTQLPEGKEKPQGAFVIGAVNKGLGNSQEVPYSCLT